MPCPPLAFITMPAPCHRRYDCMVVVNPRDESGICAESRHHAIHSFAKPNQFRESRNCIPLVRRRPLKAPSGCSNSVATSSGYSVSDRSICALSVCWSLILPAGIEGHRQCCGSHRHHALSAMRQPTMHYRKLLTVTTDNCRCSYTFEATRCRILSNQETSGL